MLLVLALALAQIVQTVPALVLVPVLALELALAKSRGRRSLEAWKNPVLFFSGKIVEILGNHTQSLSTGFSISDLRDPSPSQILGTSSRFSEDFLGRERERETPREEPLGSGRIL